jgi:hypothetical protein
MRKYRKRHNGNGENLQKYMVGQTDCHNMSFGYGNQVCHGCYLAVGEKSWFSCGYFKSFILPLQT